MSGQEASFADSEFAERYSEGPPRFVPGYHDMLRMATMPLAEDAPLRCRLLPVGSPYDPLHDGSTLATPQPICARLRPSAPLVIVDHCRDKADPQLERRLGRYARFAIDSGAPSEDVARAWGGIRQFVPMSHREREAALLAQACFRDIEIFWTGLLGTGWTARA